MRFRHALQLALMMVGSGTVVGCATEADPMIPLVNLNQMYVIGTTNTADCASTDDTVTLRFGLSSTAPNEVPLIVPGTEVNLDEVVPGLTFTAESLAFTDGVLYPSPDVLCLDDGDCDGVGDGFACVPLNPAHAASAHVCGHLIEMSPVAESLRSPGPEPQDVVLSVYYGGTMLGANPEPGGVPPVRSEWKSDPALDGVTSASTFLDLLDANGDPADRVCVASWHDEGAVRFMEDASSCFSPTGTSADREQLSGLNSPQMGFERALWSTVSSAVNQFEAHSNAGNRRLVIFTDGGDTGSMAPNAFVLAQSSAVAAGVEVHIVHLDNLALLDDTEHPYPGPQGGDDQMARLACETAGSYQIATDPMHLRHIFRSLGYTLPGHWEVDLDIPALRSDDLPAGAYRLAVSVTVDLHDSVRTYDFRGDTSSGDFGNLDDRRLVLFRR